MPLFDHFHAPICAPHSKESSLSRWANSIAGALSKTLPARYVVNVRMPTCHREATDVAEAKVLVQVSAEGTIPPVKTWVPPIPAETVPFVFSDDLTVEVRDACNDARLVGLVKLVSPWNKDRAENRLAFAVACAACLQRGIGLVMADTVGRLFNLHNELIRLLGLSQDFLMPADSPSLYVTAYRPLNREQKMDAWLFRLAARATLPVVPLALRGGPVVPLDLEETYMDALFLGPSAAGVVGVTRRDIIHR